MLKNIFAGLCHLIIVLCISSRKSRLNLEGNGTSNQQDSCHFRYYEGHFFARCSSLAPNMFFKILQNDSLLQHMFLVIREQLK